MTGARGGELFVREARKEGRTVVVMRGVSGDTGVTVEAEIYPITAPANAEPQRRPYPFPSRGDAERFADQALLALQYLGCTVAE